MTEKQQNNKLSKEVKELMEDDKKRLALLAKRIIEQDKVEE